MGFWTDQPSPFVTLSRILATYPANVFEAVFPGKPFPDQGTLATPKADEPNDIIVTMDIF